MTTITASTRSTRSRCVAAAARLAAAPRARIPALPLDDPAHVRVRRRDRGARSLARGLVPDLGRHRRSPRSAWSRSRSASWAGSAASTTGSATRSASRTKPEDHSGHGAKSWRDYFRVNTDHKVIGDPVHLHDLRLLHHRRPARADLPGRAGRAGDAVRGHADVQRARVSVHATLMIFLFIIPVFAGIGNYVIPLMLGAPDMAFPRLNALSYWLLPIAGVMFTASMVAPGRAVRDRLDGLRAAREPPADRADLLQHGRPVGGRVVDHDGAQLPRHDHHDARAGDDVLAHAAPRLGELHDLAARRPRDAVHRRLAVLRHVRPGHAHPLLRPGRRRLRARLPAHLLVLLAPGRVHHDAARLRDRLGGDLDVRAEAGLRLPADGVLARRDPHPRLLGLGAPHVRGRAWRRGCACR